VNAKATTALTAIGVTPATSRDQKVERTERTLVHSDPSRSSARMARVGELQVGVLQRGLPGHQGVYRDAVCGGEVADGGGVQAGHDQRAVVLPGDGRERLAVYQRR
jgi:hypothetical protein